MTSVLDGNPLFAFILLLGFAGLLRSGELTDLRPKQISILGGGTVLAVAHPSSKTAKRTGVPETVLIYDKILIKLGFEVLRGRHSEDKLLPGGWKQLAQGISQLASVFGVIDKLKI